MTPPLVTLTTLPYAGSGIPGRLYGSIGEDFSSLDFDEAVLPGVRAARSARFEHGEDGL